MVRQWRQVWIFLSAQHGHFEAWSNHWFGLLNARLFDKNLGMTWVGFEMGNIILSPDAPIEDGHGFIIASVRTQTSSHLDFILILHHFGAEVKIGVTS